MEPPMAPRADPAIARACAAGFVTAAGYKFAAETGARVRRFGSVTTIEYTTDIEHPWPRAFPFRLELMVEEGASAAEIDAVYRRVAGAPDTECVVDLLVADPGAL